MSKMDWHGPFGHLQHKLWPKEKSGIKLAVWLPTTGSPESTQFLCVQVACDLPLKISQQGLQLWFRPHPNRRSAQEVIVSQSCETPSLGDKSHSDVTTTKWCRIYYMGEGGGFPESGSWRVWWVRWVRGRSWLVLALKVLQPCVNQLTCWFCVGLLDWMSCLTLVLVPSRSSSTPLYPFKVLRAGNGPQVPNLSIVSILGLSLSLPRDLGTHQLDRWFMASYGQIQVIIT
jgi:hypothetical protein